MMTRAEHLARQARIAAAVRLPQGDDAAVCSLASTLLARYAAELESTLGGRWQVALPWQTREWIEHETDARVDAEALDYLQRRQGLS